MGAAAGFIAVLIVKDGRLPFIVRPTAAVPVINPYAAAFSGIVADPFTERAYVLLEGPAWIKRQASRFGESE
ncbi:hypothetical protein [Sedimentitalea nanhaiensis]|uniref:Uncharacterized protein n=1 Tax=Sedimentitalea nanhaiensis TaxID=999627 RepID=A0A1I7B5L2_9RHOB|nr:hypothetical protein [Sedimentitalea nanhaiensis]SFT82500.1 hypothetical protein SAMN05216236_108163 [Sedimentitalea nanhaiensis]